MQATQATLSCYWDVNQERVPNWPESITISQNIALKAISQIKLHCFVTHAMMDSFSEPRTK
jgi:hypothetical protein